MCSAPVDDLVDAVGQPAVASRRWLERGDLMETSEIVKQLKEYGRTRGDADWSALDRETETLVRSNPFAFLVAVAFDRGMPWEKAWRIPVEIKRMGLLDPARLASMDEADLAGLLDSLPVRPRYGTKLGGKTLSDAARLVAGRFGGDAAAIWTDSSPAEVEKTLQEIRGLGPGIASIVRGTFKNVIRIAPPLNAAEPQTDCGAL